MNHPTVYIYDHKFKSQSQRRYVLVSHHEPKDGECGVRNVKRSDDRVKLLKWKRYLNNKGQYPKLAILDQLTGDVDYLNGVH
jgi:hypothetical protein